jgi:2-octaprenyl-6-methoxyphenol hydroxylase
MVTKRRSLTADMDADVLIIGGGIVGLTLAVALANAGISVAIVDHVSPAVQRGGQYDGRASAVALGSWRIFDTIGLGPSLQRESQPILDIRVADGSVSNGASPLFLHFDHREIGEGPFGYMIENRTMRRALFDATASLARVQVLAPNTVDILNRDASGVKAVLDDGRRITSRLLVAADGRRSAIRESAGIEVREIRYAQTAIVATVQHERAHEGVAVEQFLPSGPFAMLPMTEHRANIVWTEIHEHAGGYLALSNADFKDELGRRFGDWLGAIELEGPRFSYPLGLMQAERYTARRLVLAGDAAHVIHPIAGQGLNLGLRDVAALAEIVVDSHRLGLDVGDSLLLGRYERWRRFDNTVLAYATDGLNYLFSNNVGPLRVMRDIGLSIVGKVPPVRRLLMRQAMGVLGEPPRLVRGEPL